MSSLEQREKSSVAHAKELLDLTHELYAMLPAKVIAMASELEADLEAFIAEYRESKNATRREETLLEIQKELLSTISNMRVLERITSAEAEVYYMRAGLSAARRAQLYAEGERNVNKQQAGSA